MNKCSITAFIIGIFITVSSLAFFGQMMQMPSKGFQMGSQMMFPTPEPTKCNCKCNQNGIESSNPSVGATGSIGVVGIGAAC